jgi:membrane associated rhomboid family serine protease
VLTRLLVAVNVIAYLWENVAGFDAVESRYGLIAQPVLAGEWWRLFTSAFLHASIMHIAFNMFALYQVGQWVERFYGTPRMAIIYTLSALGGSLAVVYFSPNVLTIGASGAIFGLFGALAVAGFRLGKPGRQILQQSTGIIVINLVISFLPGTNISYDAHIGGLVAGGLLGLVLFRMPRQLIAQPVAQGPGYAQRIDPRADPGVVTIEHGPIESSSQPPRA